MKSQLSFSFARPLFLAASLCVLAIAAVLAGCQKEAPAGADRPEAVAKFPPQPCGMTIGCSYGTTAINVLGIRAVSATDPFVFHSFTANGNGIFTLSPVPAGSWFLRVQVSGTFGSLTSSFDTSCYPGGSGTNWYNVIDAPFTLPCGGYKIYFSNLPC